MNFDYFVKTSQGLLFYRELPISSGLGGVNENIGDVENRGYELEVVANMFPAGNEFQWQTKFNVSAFKNEITRLPAEEISAGWFRSKVGVSAYEFYGDGSNLTGISGGIGAVNQGLLRTASQLANVAGDFSVNLLHQSLNIGVTSPISQPISFLI